MMLRWLRRMRTAPELVVDRRLAEVENAQAAAADRLDAARRRDGDVRSAVGRLLERAEPNHFGERLEKMLQGGSHG